MNAAWRGCGGGRKPRLVTPESEEEMPNDLMFRSAAELAAMVRSGDVSSRELVEASFEAIGRLNDDLNAFVTLCEARALAEADRVEPGDARPLAGVPIAIKDLVALTEGIRTSCGMAAMEEWTPNQDSALVRRIRQAGAIIVGKTNTPELGILPVTEPERFGPSRNPWDTSRTTGGSSGGSGAALASGMVPIAHGNDGGGSIRIPASCCGLVGLKPSRGRVSLAPHLGEFVGGIAIEGVLSRNVADTALALDVISGYEPGDPYWAPDPSAPFVDALERSPGSLRIGFTVEAPNGAPVHEDCATATREAATKLESLGHEVEEAAPDWGEEGYVDNFIKIWTAGNATDVEGLGLMRGRPLDLEKLEPLTRQMYEAGSSLSATEYLHALGYLRSLARRLVSFWGDHDVLLTPTLAQPPLEIGALRPGEGEPPMQMLANAAAFVPFTPAWNVTGQPAVSLPLHHSPDGLPIGVQLVGPPAGEELLISLSAQLEEAAPWADRRPQMALA
jgi:amidase